MKFDIEYWLKELELAKEELKPFRVRAERAWKTYVSEQGKKDAQRMNIMWSNVQTLRPNLYFQRPKPKAVRRVKQHAPESVIAAQIIEQATEYNCEEQSFNAAIKDVVEDYLITGRGVPWVSYEPTLETVTDPQTGKTYERLVREMMLVEHVPYSDFLHNPARAWREVEWVAKAAYLKEDDVAEVFGKQIAKKLTYNRGFGEDKDEFTAAEVEATEQDKRAQIWEIWCKRSGVIYYVCEDYTDSFVATDEPRISFREFFPCPRPIYNTTDDKSLCAYADFHFYEKQASGIDVLTERINQLSKALTYSGGYNAKYGRFFSDTLRGDNCDFVPLEDWNSFLQEGGYDGNVAAKPIDKLAPVLMQLYDAREREKAEVYEITGVSDLLRGNSNPTETATAQQIKGQYANLRLADRQQEIQRLVRDTIALCAEGIAETFQDYTLADMSGFEIEDSRFHAGLSLLRDDRMRTFSIDIETDSTLKADQAEQKQSAMEFAQALSQMVQQFSQVPNPALIPVFGELVMFVVRRFGQGRELEEGIEQAVQGIAQQAMQPPQPPPPDPKIELDKAKLEQDGQLKSRDLDIKEAKVSLDAQIEAAKIQDERDLYAARISTPIGQL